MPVESSLDAAGGRRPRSRRRSPSVSRSRRASRSPSPARGCAMRCRGSPSTSPTSPSCWSSRCCPPRPGWSRTALTYELAVRGRDDASRRRRPRPRARRAARPRAGARARRRARWPRWSRWSPVALGRPRLPGTRIDGRRHLRKLLKARRAPLGLAELAAADIAPSPGLLLTVLARAVDPAAGRPATADRRRRLRGLRPLARRGLRRRPAGDRAGPSDAGRRTADVLHTAAHRLAAVLAGTAAPGDARSRATPATSARCSPGSTAPSAASPDRRAAAPNSAACGEPARATVAALPPSDPPPILDLAREPVLRRPSARPLRVLAARRRVQHQGARQARRRVRPARARPHRPRRDERRDRDVQGLQGTRASSRSSGCEIYLVDDHANRAPGKVERNHLTLLAADEPATATSSSSPRAGFLEGLHRGKPSLDMAPARRPRRRASSR